MFTTKSAIFREAEILQRAKDGQGKNEPVIAIDKDIQKVVPDVSFTNEELNDGKRSYTDAAGSTGAGLGDQVGSPAEAGTLSSSRMREMSERGLDADKVGENTDVLPGDARPGGPGSEHLRRAVDDQRVAQVISDFEKRKGFILGDGQKAAVALALTSEDQHIGIVGAAGAGKTTSMELIVEQYKAAGYEVVGVAPSAAAAHELKSAGCDDTRTLASALMMQQKDEDAGGKKIFIMDESGMVSAKDMDAFLKKADSEGARTIMVGDPRQLAAVESGSPFAQMLETDSIKYARIDEIQRQKDPQLREIAQAFAGGDAARGVQLAKPYMVQVDVGEGGKEAKTEALAAAAASAYLELSPEERSKTLLLTGTNTTRQATNQKIREGLNREGTLGDHAVKIAALDKLDLTKEAASRAERYTSKDGAQVVVQFNSDFKNSDTEKRGGAPLAAEKGSQWDVTGTAGGKLQLRNRAESEKTLEIRPTDARISAYEVREMELRDGDRVMFRQNNKDQGVTNGTHGTVFIDEKSKACVKTDTGKNVLLDPERGQTMDYAYAKTVHMSQGATVDNTIAVGEAGRVSTAESAYVASSRERRRFTVITDNVENLCKSWCKYADRQNALDAAKVQAPESLEEIRQARGAAGHELGGVGDLAKKRAAAQENAQGKADPLFTDIPDALDPDFGAEKFAKKTEAAMEKVEKRQADAVEKSNDAATGGQTPTAEPEAPVQPQKEPVLEPELELGG